jgi:tRNA (pseudouridine54-N1)-methyltransferase
MTAKRRFVFVSHTGRADGDWPLEDLCGRAGRIDVLCRNIQSAMFLSHGLRANTDVYLAFVADPEKPVAIHLEGANIQLLNPDERSTAARIRSALRNVPLDPWWEEVEQGVKVAPFNLAQLREDLPGTPVILHVDGDALEDSTLPADPLFLLGDHHPLTEDELALWAGANSISLGPAWYHGNHVTTIIQYTLDRQLEAQNG